MKYVLVFFAAMVVAAICLECIRNKNYEDGVVGRAALWFLFFTALARDSQILGRWLTPYLGDGWIPGHIGLDNVETILWCALFCFFARHYYRFRRALTDDAYAWRPSQKMEHNGS